MIRVRGWTGHLLRTPAPADQEIHERRSGSPMTDRLPGAGKLAGKHQLSRPDRLWLRWAAAVLAADLVIHLLRRGLARQRLRGLGGWSPGAPSCLCSAPGW